MQRGLYSHEYSTPLVLKPFPNAWIIITDKKELLHIKQLQRQLELVLQEPGKKVYFF